MTAVSLVLFEDDHSVMEHNIIGSSYSPTGYVEGIEPGEEIRSKPRGSVADIAAVSALCNDAKILGHDEHSEDEKDFERVGEPTEGRYSILSIYIHANIAYRIQPLNYSSVGMNRSISCSLYFGRKTWWIRER
jgi:hypothetical protein